MTLQLFKLMNRRRSGSPLASAAGRVYKTPAENRQHGPTTCSLADGLSFTALHKAVAREPCAFNFGMVEDAITQKVIERADPDWKQCLPMDGRTTHWKSEFARDVAAMANSGEGTIVFGITEDRKTSAASSVSGTGDTTDSKLRTLHAVAFENTHPPVLGMVFTPLTDDDKSVLTLDIPDSADAQHLIYNRDYFGSPLRNGTATSWMNERLLHDAYRLRFGIAAARSKSFGDLLESALPRNQKYLSLWIGAAAQPTVPRATGVGRVTSEQARSIVSQARDLRFVLAPRVDHTPLERMDGANLQMGLRRWVGGDNAPGQKFHLDAVYRASIVEIHDDGSLTLAAAMGGFESGEPNRPNHIHAEHAEAFVTDFMALLASTARVLSIGGNYETVLNMRSDIGPIVIRLPDQNGGRLDLEYSTPLNEFVPVSATVPAEATNAMLLTATKGHSGGWCVPFGTRRRSTQLLRQTPKKPQALFRSPTISL